MDAAAYYSDLTKQYGRYAGDARGWHYGLWEPDVRTHQVALVRSNERLLRGLDIDSRTRILDVGAGIGGFATWAARRFGCLVTGITLCADHVTLATRAAASAGVGAACAFQVMDMDRLAFDDARFDCVVNQDTLCHASAKAHYLASVYRALAPGGYWRALDFNVDEAPLTPEQQREYDVVCEGFHIPSMARGSDVRRWLEEAGFEDIQVEDVTAQVLNTARHIIRMCYPPLVLMRLGLDWMIFSRDARRRSNRQGHVRAGLAYSRGLQTGCFRHLYYSARRPR